MFIWTTNCVSSRKRTRQALKTSSPEVWQELDALLAKSTVFRLPHEQIIQKLDQSARVFKILTIKTQMLIPYTSVFFELDCGYWNAEAEERLREAIMKAHGKTK